MILLPLEKGTCQRKQQVFTIPGLTATMKPTFNIFEPYEAVAVEYCVIFGLFNVHKLRCAIIFQDNFDICFNSFRQVVIDNSTGS